MCRKYFMSAVHINTYVGQWRQSSCLCCPFPPPHLSSATAPSSPLKASHFPPSLYGSSPSPESQQGQDERPKDRKTEIFFWHKHFIFWSKGTRTASCIVCDLVWEAGGQHQVVLQLLDDAVPLRSRLEKHLLGLTQLGLVLTLLFVVLPGWRSRGCQPQEKWQLLVVFELLIML